MLRTRTSRWTLMTAGLSLILLVTSWFLLIGPRRAQTADLRAQRVATQEQNDQLEARISQLRAQFAQLPTQRAELASVLRQIPATADVPQLVRDLNGLALASGVTVDSIARSPAASVTAAPGAAKSATTVQLVQIPLTIVVHGDFFQAVAFLQKLQTQLPRAVLISGIQVAPNTSSGGAAGQVQVSLSGAVYVWPDGAKAAATPTQTAGPTAGVTAGPTAGVTTAPTASATSTTATSATGTSTAPSASSTGGTP